MPTLTTSQTRRRAIAQISDELYRRRDTSEVGLMARLLELMLEEVQNDFIRAPVADLPRVQATAGQLAQLIKMLSQARASTINGDTHAS